MTAFQLTWHSWWSPVDLRGTRAKSLYFLTLRVVVNIAPLVTQFFPKYVIYTNFIFGFT